MEFSHEFRRDLVHHAFFGFEVEGAVDELAHLLAVSRFDAEESGDDGRRHSGAEVLHVVEGSAADVRVEQIGAEFPDLALEYGHATWREGLGYQAAQTGVIGRIREDHHAADDRRTHELEHRAMGRAERPGIAVGRIDVHESTQGVEVMCLVVIDRRFVPEETPHGVRVVLVLLADGIPRQWALGPDRRHETSHNLMPPRIPALLSTTVMRSRISPNSSRFTLRAFPPPM